MKKITAGIGLIMVTLVACNKNNTSTDQISLSASTTEATVGQTVTVTASTNANALSWSVNPSTNVNKTFGVTTEKTNYFTFTQAGEYTIGARAGKIHLDSMHQCHPMDSLHFHTQDSLWHNHVDSVWHQEGHHRKDCHRGVDSASIIIKVK